MTVLRYANRVPLQFQHAACAITQMIMQTNWRSYGLTQSRGSLPAGPVTVMVHMASVWVPFTSESKEAIASYPEIQKELRLAVQAVGRKLAMYLRRRLQVKHEGERRSIFLRYLGEVATAVSGINQADRDSLYEQLLKIAKRKTAVADTKFDERGQAIEEEEEDFGDNVLIVDPSTHHAIGPSWARKCWRRDGRHERGRGNAEQAKVTEGEDSEGRRPRRNKPRPARPGAPPQPNEEAAKQ